MRIDAIAISLKTKLINQKFVKFFLSAGVSFLVDVTVYFILYNYINQTQNLRARIVGINSHSLCLLISYTFGVVTNFLLTKYTVFKDSDLATRKQFFRYAVIASVGFLANYALLRCLVELFEIWATLARIISALSLAIASYFIHKLFTFRIKN